MAQPTMNPRSWRRVVDLHRPFVAWLPWAGLVRAGTACDIWRIHPPVLPMPQEPASADLVDALRRMGLLAGVPALEPLAGGVSSDIWRVEDGCRVFVVKRALGKLRVAADWRAPVERNRYEVAWMREASAVAPDVVTAILGDDPAAGLFAMAWLAPQDHPVWKAQLHEGHADPAFAARVGAVLAAIHSATAGRADIAARFATDHIFQPIRLEPYLEATALRHPLVADRLTALSRSTLAKKIALVHGDVSPKNILAGPRGPVFLDAECAWYGDPAFDLAFCLNHMLLKCLWTPAATRGFLACFDALSAAYLAGVGFEPPAALEARAAALLPGLFLARVDGKSPVEYVRRDEERNRVRATALPLLADPPPRLSAVRDAWAARLGSQ
ncbi:MAG: phosphotransferase [Burkholderiales bacterium]|nr:phosphotransferase [Burkholderiales bacterium]